MPFLSEWHVAPSDNATYCTSNQTVSGAPASITAIPTYIISYIRPGISSNQSRLLILLATCFTLFRGEVRLLHRYVYTCGAGHRSKIVTIWQNEVQTRTQAADCTCMQYLPFLKSKPQSLKQLHHITNRCNTYTRYEGWQFGCVLWKSASNAALN